MKEMTEFTEKFNESASDIQKHAADEIANSLREADSSYIRISVFLDTKEIENIKKRHNSVVIGTSKTIA